MQRSYSILKKIFTLFLLGGLAGLLIICATYLYLSPKLPPVDVLREANLQVPLRIYSQNGELIGEFGEKLRTPIIMADVPELFINAILSAEDDRFLQHQGIDIAGLLRAAAQLFVSGEIKSGGSTITMQVARNFFLSSEQTFVRKFNEIFLALQIERTLSKGDILELYVNKIYLGKRAYGIQAAAAVYYGKPIADLSMAQLAMIAGLPKAPSSYNPINNPERAQIRRNWILGRMHKLGYISEDDWRTAAAEPVSAEYHGPKLELNASYAAEMARAIAVEKFGRAAYTDGYNVITSIDSDKQRSAQRAVAAGLIDYDLRHGYRGPEKRLGELGTDEWLAQLKTFNTVNNMVPVVVSKLYPPEAPSAELKPGQTKQAMSLLFADGSSLEFVWDSETNPLRGYINEDRRTAKIKNIDELLGVGDIIRLRISDTGTKPIISQLPAASASLVALKPTDGAIQALVGGFDFELSKFNRATQAYRQTGSNFKPFIYAAALENGFNAASIINDAPIVFNDNQLESNWRPENSSGKFYGPTTLRRALYLSRNLVSVRLLRELGIDRAIQYLNRFELSNEPLPRDLSLSLGSYSMTPLEVASAYAMLANGGFKVTPHLVTQIQDRAGNPVFTTIKTVACPDCSDGQLDQQLAQNIEAEPVVIKQAGTITDDKIKPTSIAAFDDEIDEAESLEALLVEELITEVAAPRVMDPRVVYIIDNILQDVIRRGTATKAKVLGRADLAGKTGTTNGPTDAWFSGYHPSLVTTTWLGFDNNQLLGRREFGGSAALPIWIDFMRDSLTGVAEATRSRPAGMVSVKINRLTGSTSNTDDGENLFESFLEEYAPEQNNTANNTAANNNQQIFDEELF